MEASWIRKPDDTVYTVGKYIHCWKEEKDYRKMLQSYRTDQMIPFRKRQAGSCQMFETELTSMGNTDEK